MKKLLLLISIFSFSSILGADLNIDPTYLKLKVYKFSVSTSFLCTNPITVLENTNPSYIDVIGNPDFGNGSIADGTYPCVIIEFSDNIKYQPNANSTSGNCASGTEYTLDVCSASSGATVTMTDGSTKTCDNTEQRITMYLSTASTTVSGNANAFTPPTSASDATKGFKLTNALSVTGSTVGKFVVNGTDKICDTNDGACNGSANTCEMQPPLFSFSKI